MEIPRSIRYAFSSPEGRRKMKERKDIIQGMFDTIISHSPPPQISLYTQPDKSKPALYRGTLSGWVVMGSLRQDPVLTSGYSYHTDVASVSTSFEYSNNFPLAHQDGDPDIKYALGRVIRREGIHVTREGRRDLVSKLSKRVTVQVNREGLDFTEPDEEKGSAVIRVPIASLTTWSANNFIGQIGVNPVDIVQRLQSI